MATVKGRVELDIGLVVAAERLATGANIHNVNNLLQLYIMACWTGNVPSADVHAGKLRKLLILQARRANA